ncbi:PREDICTED: uncharacterized protein LOC109159400 [Ipomoea nil]|uniref:uncharacterized protein LOC109159400 n=1 Tax=Ipomoea nil TaxID=35883 RepID=UPI000900E1AF|nr:PREDICTED: uncharacterized protein LOC109159400 [Ipomoea nil]
MSQLLLKQEDVYWKQRAKQHWLREGDMNTRFFHLSASNRKRKNQLLKLRNGEGSWVEGQGLESLVVSYYEGIFTSGGCRGANFFESLQPCVTGDMNEELVRPFNAEEVREAVFAMSPDKALGPDSMNPGFFQNFWEVVGRDVITKMLANRMKRLLKDIVSESQSAFLPGRLIIDNILVAAEISHYLRRKTTGKVGWAALKFHMAKAYDRMEWEFLRRMLLGLGGRGG